MTIYISLGNTCGVAYQLRKHNLRHISFPFDWFKTPKLSTIIKLIENKFDGLLDEKYFKFIKYSDKFFDSEGLSQVMALYKNTKYNLIFYHDFIKEKTFEEQFLIIKERYQRRIKRFYDILNSDEELVFVRDDIYEKINICELKYLISLIKSKLIVIIHNPNNKPILNISNIIIYNDIDIYQDWKRDNLDWYKILNLVK